MLKDMWHFLVAKLFKRFGVFESVRGSLGPLTCDWEGASVPLKRVLVGLAAKKSGDHALSRILLSGEPYQGELLAPVFSGCHGYLYTEVLHQAHLCRQLGMVLPVSAIDWIRVDDPVLYGLLKSIGMPVVPRMCLEVSLQYRAERLNAAIVS